MAKHLLSSNQTCCFNLLNVRFLKLSASGALLAVSSLGFPCSLLGVQRGITGRYTRGTGTIDSFLITREL